MELPFPLKSIIIAYAYDFNTFVFFGLDPSQFALKLLGRCQKEEVKVTEFLHDWPKKCTCGNHILQFSSKYFLTKVVLHQLEELVSDFKLINLNPDTERSLIRMMVQCNSLAMVKRILQFIPYYFERFVDELAMKGY